MANICRLCPRDCGVNREVERGSCNAGEKVTLYRAALHFWEEPCLSGRNGSGAVFFSGCPLQCVYCQNRVISSGEKGIEVTRKRLVEIFFELKAEKAENINLVTAGHFLPEVIWAVREAKREGLGLPFVWNSSGYEKREAIKALEGLIDWYLPDFKYFTSETAAMYSAAPDYPEIAMDSIEEMVRQRGDGVHVIVRHLLLPGHVKEACAIVRYLYETYGDSIVLSLMNQYTPMPGINKTYPSLARRVTKREYGKLIDFALSIGVTNAFIQEGDTAKSSFIPDFNGKGVYTNREGESLNESDTYGNLG